MKKLFSLFAVLALVIGVAFVTPTQVKAFGPGDNPSFDICDVLPWLPFCEEEEEPVDVCENLEGVQEETPEGYVNEQGTCTPEEPPVDYCETLEGVQTIDADCPAPEEEECPPGTHEVKNEAWEEEEEYELVCEPDEPEQPSQPGNPPTFAGSSTEAPQCGDGSTTQLPANVHVLRAGEEATVNFFITEGDSANLYWRVVGSGSWQHAASNLKPNSDNFVSYTVHGLDPNLGYDFGVQQKKGCGGGQLVTAVVVDGPAPVLYPFSYWEWSN